MRRIILALMLALVMAAITGGTAPAVLCASIPTRLRRVRAQDSYLPSF